MNYFTMGGSRGEGGSESGSPGKSQVAIGFLRNTGMDLTREAIGPEGPIASRGRIVRQSVKYADN